jgi:hypothetical protein
MASLCSRPGDTMATCEALPSPRADHIRPRRSDIAGRMTAGISSEPAASSPDTLPKGHAAFCRGLAGILIRLRAADRGRMWGTGMSPRHACTWNSSDSVQAMRQRRSGQE